jgi:hypothetical protein
VRVIAESASETQPMVTARIEKVTQRARNLTPIFVRDRAASMGSRNSKCQRSGVGASEGQFITAAAGMP